MSDTNFQIRRDDLCSLEIRALLEEHLAHMRALSPPESVHALALERLRQPDIAFWTAWDGADLLGCGALKRLGDHDGEIKSMRTAMRHQRCGVARAMLAHILAQARTAGLKRVWLETGPTEGFAPARGLYAAFGFVPCGPFADYTHDPHSAFMRLDL